MVSEASCSRLPNSVPGFTEIDRQLHFQIARVFIGHRVIEFVQLRQQAQTELLDEAVGLDPGLVLVEANVGIQPVMPT